MSAHNLTARDIERLGDLIAGYDQARKYDGNERGVAPIDCGGMDGTDHSYRFSKLAKLGLAEQRYRGLGWNERPRKSAIMRGSKLYRPTEAGRSAYQSAKGKQ